MAFSDSLTQQQKDDFLFARGIDFDTFVQRQVDETTINARAIRINQAITQIFLLPQTEQDQIVANIQAAATAQLQIGVQNVPTP